MTFREFLETNGHSLTSAQERFFAALETKPGMTFHIQNSRATGQRHLMIWYVAYRQKYRNQK